MSAAATVWVLGSTTSALAAHLSTAQMATIAHRAIADDLRITGDDGTTGLRPILERCYRRAAIVKTESEAAYCIMLDRAATITTVKLFPNADDPYYNMPTFAQRVLLAVEHSIQPPPYRMPFIKNLMEVEDAESELAGYDAEKASAGQGGSQ